MKIKEVFLLLFCFISLFVSAQDTTWPKITSEMKPGTRWWWLGSAVDKENLTFNLNAYAKAGLGAVEITPIYGVQNNDHNDIPFLSDKWMEMLKHAQSEAEDCGMFVDMNTGTGWPFGGPGVTVEDAASKLLIKEYNVQGGKLFNEVIRPDEKNQQEVARILRLMAYQGNNVLDITDKIDNKGNVSVKLPSGDWKVIAAFLGKTFQKVKRAAPGGEGYVIDHFSKVAVEKYLTRFDNVFQDNNAIYPNNFFNDSYEVYGADWTADFFEQFYQRRGYKLENYLLSFLSKERTDETARIMSDYRETIAEILLENFTNQWTDWSHKNGSKTRNQAHGSPGNLIDIYAAVDIPECEGFGLSDFGIKGLRTDSLIRHNDSDLSMLKYASSAAHITGKPYISSETFTWLTEHFRTSLSQCKPDMDLMFVAGVNHMYFHGSTYSPKQAQWPGWRFYASIDMTPYNSIWRDAPGLFSYITRCQSFLQMGKPDSDFLIYVPLYDAWYEQPGRLLMFSIHDMAKRMPQFIEVVHSVYNSGYDVDYISDKFILSIKYLDGKLISQGGNTYEALILPAVNQMPEYVLEHIMKLASEGAKVLFMENYPNDVPGLHNLQNRRDALKKALRKVNKDTDFSETKIEVFGKGKIITGTDYEKTLQAIGKRPEEMVAKHNLNMIRRTNADGYHYFISALNDKGSDEWITLSVPALSAMFFDPMTGESGKALVRQNEKGTQVRLQLKSGQSIILKTFSKVDINTPHWSYLEKKSGTIPLNKQWNLHFQDSYPEIAETFKLDKPISWTELSHDDVKRNMATGIYETSFEINNQDQHAEYVLNLGDVRESARVFVNDKEVGIVWAAPFECRIGKYLKEGENSFRIEVTNLPANRIADYDRKKKNWRIFKEINVVNINYKNDDYGDWKPMPSGLVGEISIDVYK